MHSAGNYLSDAQSFDYSHNRQIHRRVEVYPAPTQLQQKWPGLKCLIWIARWGLRQGKPFEEKMGYISDLDLDADTFCVHIQHHWNIENRLHWVRDVTFEEDFARPGGNAPVIWAILNCFIISIIRQLGYRTIPQGVRILTNQVRRIFEILTVGFSPPK